MKKKSLFSFYNDQFMKNLSKVLLLFVALGVTLATSSCKKEDEPTKTELLTKTWKISEVYVNGQLDADPSYGMYRFTFTATGTYNITYTGGADNGVWEFNTDESRIIFDKGTADEDTWEVMSLTMESSRMKATDDGDTLELLFVPA